MKKLGIMMLCAILVITLLPLNALAYDHDGFTYDQNDYEKLLAFLETEADGIKNGNRVSATYDPTAPQTWAVSWSRYNFEGPLRVNSLRWDEKGLYGSLDLSNCINLLYIHCENNNLTGLNFTGCTSLDLIRCANNPLYSFEARGLTKLTELIAGNHSALTSLDLTGCTSLQLLMCDDCPALETLILNGCSSLERAYCSDNAVKTIGLDGLSAVTKLWVTNNKITSLDLSQCPNLQDLCCDNNPLTYLDTSSCPSLVIINLSNCCLDTIDVSSNTALKVLVTKNTQTTLLKANMNGGSINVKANFGGYFDVTAYGEMSARITGIWLDGFMFDCWTNGTERLTTGSIYEVSEGGSCDITANFRPMTYTERKNVLAGDVFTLTPGAEGGTWYYDSCFSLNGNSFTALSPVDKAYIYYKLGTNITIYQVKIYPALALEATPASGCINVGGDINFKTSVTGGTWSYDKSYLSRTSTGFTGIKPGTTRVTYSAMNHAVSFDIVILQGEAPKPPSDPDPKSQTAVGISFTQKDVVQYGRTDGVVTITATGGDSGTYEYSINNGQSWQNSNVFSGLAAGAYTAVARDTANPNNMASVSLTILQPPCLGRYLANKLPSKASIKTALTIIPPVAPKGYTVQSVTYASSNPAIAPVDANGNVTFLAGGKVTIITKVVSQTVDKKGRVKIKTTTVKKTITVNQLVENIALNLGNATIARTQKVTLTANIAPGTASNKKLKWTSSNPKVAAVSSAGVVTGKTGGTAVVTCRATDGSGASASCTVNVTPIYTTGVKMSKAALTVKLGKTASLKATVAPKNTDFKTVAWASSNPGVAVVDARGKVRTIAPGTAVITATTSGGQTASCTITVP